MKTLSRVFTLVVASLKQTTIQPASATGIPVAEADRVELEARLARLGAAAAEIFARLTAPTDDRFPGKIAQAGFFNEEWSLQER